MKKRKEINNADKLYIDTYKTMTPIEISNNIGLAEATVEKYLSELVTTKMTKKQRENFKMFSKRKGSVIMTEQISTFMDKTNRLNKKPNTKHTTKARKDEN